MRKDRISVALRKDLIEKLNEASEKARRSRSDYLQIVLEEYFARLQAEGWKSEAATLRSAH